MEEKISVIRKMASNILDRIDIIFFLMERQIKINKKMIKIRVNIFHRGNGNNVKNGEIKIFAYINI
jgi:hypothetical protein